MNPSVTVGQSTFVCVLCLVFPCPLFPFLFLASVVLGGTSAPHAPDAHARAHTITPVPVRARSPVLGPVLSAPEGRL
ncbi:hypothetical protein B0H17DRAFT_1065978 [Mycena rosella]|uniref:Uncharacterized protein n=1 Tax=Mycena rosella TaxID=1033263 RepID=A0AAD7GHX7_MYCRO|nr:hypothetical protein B0H17DRAFT_1065978 [Mycena rosella]